MITYELYYKLSSSKISMKNEIQQYIDDNIDKLLKYTMFISFKETVTASVLAYMLLRNWLTIMNYQENLSSTEIKLFTSKDSEKLSHETWNKTQNVTAYHSQTDDQVESRIKMVENIFVIMSIKQLSYDWLFYNTVMCTTISRNEIMKKHHFIWIMNTIQRWWFITQIWESKWFWKGIIKRWKKLPSWFQ